MNDNPITPAESESRRRSILRHPAAWIVGGIFLFGYIIIHVALMGWNKDYGREAVWRLFNGRLPFQVPDSEFEVVYADIDTRDGIIWKIQRPKDPEDGWFESEINLHKLQRTDHQHVYKHENHYLIVIPLENSGAYIAHTGAGSPEDAIRWARSKGALE